MTSFVANITALGCLAIALSGCNQHTSSMFTPPSNVSGAAVNAPAPAPAISATATAGRAPYVLSAQSAGPYINFSIYNMGVTDLVVKKEDFAVIDPDNREVTPYDKANAVIDLPQPATVKPNETMHGRAIFHDVTSPIGKRLVYKPDTIGTFADINRASGMGATGI